MARLKLKQVWTIIKRALSDWWAHDAFAQAGAISFFALFSLAPLLVIAVAIAGQFFGRDEVRAAIISQFTEMLGERGGEYMGVLIDNASDPGQGLVASIIGVGTLIIAASGAFIQLRIAMNNIWGVQPKPGLGIWRFIRGRLVSFGLALGIAFLLLVSLVISALLAGFAQWSEGLLPGQELLMRGGNFLVSFLVIAVLFAAIFRFLPDAEIGWRETVIGSLITTLLFSIGRFAIGAYLGQGAPGSVYGAAGSLAIVLFWVYFSTLIFLLGAEITHQHAIMLGKRTTPKPDAERAPVEATSENRPSALPRQA